MARAVPSGRDLRKYARLFLRTDHDSDGFISADEAKAVFNKSYLPPDVLINIFNQANVSQSPYLTFPEFVAAMHLIREARQTQQPSQFPSISAELMNFLSNFYESPWDLAIQGSSKSAQALKQSAQSAQDAQGAQTHQSFSHGDPTYQTQADSGLGQEKNDIDSAVPPTPDFPSAGNFEATKTEAAFSNDMAFADSDFGFGHAEKTEKAEKGKRKKDKKEKKQKEEKKEMTEMTTEPSFGAEWTTFGQDPGLAADVEIRENWPSFGNENEMSFGLEDDKEKLKQKRRQKDQKDSQKDSQKDFQKDSEKGQNTWSDDLQLQATRESFVPHFGQDSTDRPSWDLSLPQPRTRFGLPVSPHGEQGLEQEQRDPDYVARLEEILGVSKVHAGEAARLDKQNSQWAGRRHDGHFEERYRTAFMDLGYGSPGVYVSLMGLKSNSHAIPRVLPEPAKPFLKTVAPNFVPNFQAGGSGRSKPAFDLLRMR